MQLEVGGKKKRVGHFEVTLNYLLTPAVSFLQKKIGSTMRKILWENTVKIF